jgi:hypothetical protein
VTASDHPIGVTYSSTHCIHHYTRATLANCTDTRVASIGTPSISLTLFTRDCSTTTMDIQNKVRHERP